jgi:elongation factor Tu
MFSVRIEDIFYVKGQGMVLSGRVETGKVCIGARVVLRTPVTSVLAVLSGVERNRQVVRCASSGEDVALMIRQVDPSQLTGGIEFVQSDENVVSPWRVLSLLVEETPNRWWEFWK